MADILRQIYYGRCTTAYIYIYISADILRHIYIYIYYGRYIAAYVYTTTLMGDTLRQIHCVQQKRPYLKKCPALEALDCCVRICPLQRIAPRTTLDRFILLWALFVGPHGALGAPFGTLWRPLWPLWAFLVPLWAPLGPGGHPLVQGGGQPSPQWLQGPWYGDFGHVPAMKAPSLRLAYISDIWWCAGGSVHDPSWFAQPSLF